MSGVVIVGAGECGTRAAFALRDAGYKGAVTLLGAEDAAPYERPPLSKPDGDGLLTRKLICDDEALSAAGIDYRQGARVSAIDTSSQQVVLGDGQALGYDRLLLATGARPRALSCRGAERARTFRTFEEAVEVHATAGADTRVAIIGAGLIGMELAAVLRSRGAAVTVIEAAASPLGRAVPRPLAERLLSRHREAGVSFLFDARIAAIDAEGVAFEDGETVAADLVIAAIGVVPETGLAEAAGLKTGNGIRVDACLRSSAPNVFAAGDCACIDTGDGAPVRFESWRNARAQAEAAANNIAGEASPFAAPQWFWSDQYELGLQSVGSADPGHRIVRRDLGNGAEMLFFLDASSALKAAAGLGPGNSVAKDIRLAEMLIAAGARPEEAALADPAINLKTLLKAAKSG